MKIIPLYSEAALPIYPHLTHLYYLPCCPKTIILNTIGASIHNTLQVDFRK
jgi:hypothetical protein